MIEYEYVWLDLIGYIPIEALAKLKAIYLFEYRIYLATFCLQNFKKVLIQNNILIPKDTFRNMVSLKFKEYIIKVVQILKQRQIELIGVLQKEYPVSLRKCENCPTAIYLIKDEKSENHKFETLKNSFVNMYKLYMLEEKNEFNKEILDYIWTKTIYIKGKRYITEKSIIGDDGILIDDDAKELRLISICKVGDLNVYVLKKEQIDIDKEKFMLSIIDGLVIARVSNIERGIDIVDYVLENGRDVFAVPGNILYRENYLANHVIKQGAYVVTNRYDMKNLI